MSTPQHPAAPETETDANGLTKAVAFAPMRPAPLEEAWPLGDQDGYAIRLCTCEEGAYLGARLGGTPCRCERCGFITLDQWEHIVTRIVAERVRVVEGERDAVVEVGAYAQQKEATARAVNDAARMAQVAARRTRELAAMTARAESAEAAHEAEKAAHERLRAGVEALAGKWEAASEATWRDVLGRSAPSITFRAAADHLRSLLGGGEAR